jgi:pimeloyl-ACP methyl ester carboxylesterase
MKTIIHLHGFASSSGSTKAQYLKRKLGGYPEVDFRPFEFNPTPRDFEFMTVTGMINRLRQYLLDHNSEPICLIGSSMGALVGLHYAHRFGQVDRMLLLAPALVHPAATISQEKLKERERERDSTTLIHHYAFRKQVPLRYAYFHDGLNYVKPPPPPAPILILHGRSDKVIPIAHSRDYAERYDQVDLLAVEAGHQLNDRLPAIWEQVQSFLLGSETVG